MPFSSVIAPLSLRGYAIPAAISHPSPCHCVQLAIRNALSLRSACYSQCFVIARSDSAAAISYSARDSHATLRFAQNDRGGYCHTERRRMPLFLSYRAEAYAPFFVIPSVGDSRSRVYLLSIHATTYAISVQFTQGNALQFTFLLKNNSRTHRVQFTSVRTIHATIRLQFPFSPVLFSQ